MVELTEQQRTRIEALADINTALLQYREAGGKVQLITLWRDKGVMLNLPRVCVDSNGNLSIKDEQDEGL